MKLSTDKTAIRPLNTNCNLPEVYSYFWKYSIIVFVAAQAPCEPRRTPGCRSQPAPPGRSFIEQIQHEPGSASPGNCGPHTGHNSFRAVSNFNKIFWRQNSKAELTFCNIDSSSPGPRDTPQCWDPVFCNSGCCSSGVGVRGRYS